MKAVWRRRIQRAGPSAQFQRIYSSLMGATKAKVFWSGSSQAVRLPKDLRIDGDEVLIEESGDRLIVKPLRRQWSRRFLDSFGAATDLKRFRQPRQD
jgi:virulence-associated protein VagC